MNLEIKVTILVEKIIFDSRTKQEPKGMHTYARVRTVIDEI